MQSFSCVNLSLCTLNSWNEAHGVLCEKSAMDFFFIAWYSFGDPVYVVAYKIQDRLLEQIFFKFVYLCFCYFPTGWECLCSQRKTDQGAEHLSGRDFQGLGCAPWWWWSDPYHCPCIWVLRQNKGTVPGSFDCCSKFRVCRVCLSHSQQVECDWNLFRESQ